MQFEIRNYNDGHQEAVISHRTLKDTLLLMFLPRKKEIIFTVEDSEEEEKQ